MRADLIRARLEAGEVAKLGLTLIYGPPGGGKTYFCAAGIASSLIDRVFFFSFDGGYETLLSTKKGNGEFLLSSEDLAKVEIFTTSESETEANAGPLIRYILANPKWSGWINPRGQRLTGEGTEKDAYWPGLSTLTERDLLILDPLSFLGMSIHRHNTLKNPPKTKSGAIDTQGIYGRDKEQQIGILGALSGHPFHTACLTHAMSPDVELRDRSFDKDYPEFGSKNMSVLTGSWFGNIIFLHTEGGKFKAGSHPLYKPRVIARSRWGIDLSKIENPTLADLIQLRKSN